VFGAGGLTLGRSRRRLIILKHVSGNPYGRPNAGPGEIMFVAELNLDINWRFSKAMASILCSLNARC